MTAVNAHHKQQIPDSIKNAEGLACCIITDADLHTFMPYVSSSACVCLVDITGAFLVAIQKPQEYRRADFCTVADGELYTCAALCQHICLVNFEKRHPLVVLGN